MATVAIGTTAAEHIQDVAGDGRYLLIAPRGALQRRYAVPQQRACGRRHSISLRPIISRRSSGQSHIDPSINYCDSGLFISARRSPRDADVCRRCLETSIVFRSGLGRLAGWHLSGGPVGPASRWAASQMLK